MLRNSLMPIITMFGLDFATLLGGAALVTETVFNLPGIGQYEAQAIGNLDVPPILVGRCSRRSSWFCSAPSPTCSMPCSTRESDSPADDQRPPHG